MENIPIVIFIILFSFILLNSLYLKRSCNSIIEGLETKNTDKSNTNTNANTNDNEDDEDEDIKQRFKKLQDKVNKIQDQLVNAEKSNNENAQTLKQLNK